MFTKTQILIVIAFALLTISNVAALADSPLWTWLFQDDEEITPKGVAKAFMMALEAGDFDAAADLMSDNFQFSGPVPEPIGKEAYLGLISQMIAGFPDWSFNMCGFEADNDLVQFTVEITGTHTADLDLSPMGLPIIPATDIEIALPVEHPEITVEDGLITVFHSPVTEGGGVTGILKALGVESPAE